MSSCSCACTSSAESACSQATPPADSLTAVACGGFARAATVRWRPASRVSIGRRARDLVEKRRTGEAVERALGSVRVYHRPPMRAALFACAGLLFFGVAACDSTDRCKSKPDCTKLGKCTVDENGLCIVDSDEDCKASEECTVKGKCTARFNECVAATNSDCQRSADCKKLGNCSAHQGSCEDPTKTVHAECAKTCGTEGTCVTQGDKCVALSRRHCSGTFDEKPDEGSPCARLGACKAEDGLCVAGSTEDCAQSSACKKEAQCTAADGRCVADEEACKKSDACSKDGRCGVKDGKCAAVASADCQKSSRCKLEGACSAKDGACVASSSVDCARSANCKTVNHCTAKNGVCVSSGKRSQGSSEAPDKTRSTKMHGIGGL